MTARVHEIRELSPPANRAPGYRRDLTLAQNDALQWLRDHNGTGVFAEKNRQVLIAGGDRAPVTRATWNALGVAGVVTIDGRRVTIKAGV